MGEELLTLPKHISLTHGFCWIRGAPSLVFVAVFCQQLYLCVFFSLLFRLNIVLSVLQPTKCTSFEYPFGIFIFFF